MICLFLLSINKYQNHENCLLDGYVLNPGDLCWERIKSFGECKIYDRKPPELTLERSKDADILISNKVVLNKKIIENLPNLKYI